MKIQTRTLPTLDPHKCAFHTHVWHAYTNSHYASTHTHLYTRAQKIHKEAHLLSFIDVCTLTYTYADLHVSHAHIAHIQTFITQACALAYTHAHKNTVTGAHILSYIDVRTRTRTHTYTYTDLHMHTACMQRKKGGDEEIIRTHTHARSH